MPNKITKDTILAALSKVQEPELHKDLVTLNMIRNLEIERRQGLFHGHADHARLPAARPD